MFTKASQCMFFKNAKLRIDAEGHRLAEVALVIELFTHSLAEEVYPELSTHVFDEHGLIRHELHDITINPGLGLQRVSFHLDVAMQPELVSKEVRVLKYQAKRIEDSEGLETVRFIVTTELPLDTKTSREFVVNHFGHDVYVKSESVQLALTEA